MIYRPVFSDHVSLQKVNNGLVVNARHEEEAKDKLVNLLSSLSVREKETLLGLRYPKLEKLSPVFDFDDSELVV